MYNMKRSILYLLLFLTCVCARAQYNAYNSFNRMMIVSWERGSDGYYHRIENKMVDEVFGVMKNYAYDKKARNLYVLTPNANVMITLEKDYAKVVKKNKMIPQLKGEDLNKAIETQTEALDNKFQLLNEQWRKHIEDSIAKARADSIERVREHERQLAARRKAALMYRNTHNWRMVPTDNVDLYCTDCEKTFSDDSTFCIGMRNDSLYFITTVEGDLDESYLKMHVASIPEELKDKSNFMYHCDIFRDSLSVDTLDYAGAMRYINYESFNNYVSRVKNKAPYGFFEKWSWGNEYSMVTFDFTYTNLNAKTIKYITVFFKITNDVGDVDCTGHFTGTGPLKQYETASWDWDSSTYFTSGDSSKMKITRVVLTWMNGKKQAIPDNYLWFNEDED